MRASRQWWLPADAARRAAKSLVQHTKQSRRGAPARGSGALSARPSACAAHTLSAHAMKCSPHRVVAVTCVAAVNRWGGGVRRWLGAVERPTAGVLCWQRASSCHQHTKGHIGQHIIMQHASLRATHIHTAADPPKAKPCPVRASSSVLFANTIATLVLTLSAHANASLDHEELCTPIGVLGVWCVPGSLERRLQQLESCAGASCCATASLAGWRFKGGCYVCCLKRSLMEF